MSGLLQIERLSLETPDETAIIAARLLMREIHPLSRFKTPQAFLGNCEPTTHELNALMEAPDSIVAAMLTHTNENLTIVRALAVTPERRGCGHCRTLMHHAASQAIDRGHEVISLRPWGEGSAVYSRLGFNFDERGKTMVARTQTVLQH